MPDDRRRGAPYAVDVGRVAHRPGHYVTCPACSSKDIAPIVYGEPDAEGAAAEKRGEVVLGGCLVGNDSHAFKCRACGEEFGTWTGGQEESDG